MGCGGSKEEVATGNTVATKSLQRKASDVLKSFENADIANGGNGEIAKEFAQKLSMPSDEGKAISKDSPDRYFSSRKDETAVAGVAEAAATADSSQGKNEVVVKDAEAPLNAELSPREKPDAKAVQDSKDSEAVTVAEKKK